MSVEAISWALGAVAPCSGCKLVLLVLANYADDRGLCWPSQERIARQAQVSVDTVQRRLADLEAVAMVEKIERPGVRGKSTGGRGRFFYRLQISTASDNATQTTPQHAASEEKYTADEPEYTAGRPESTPQGARKVHRTGAVLTVKENRQREPSEEPSLRACSCDDDQPTLDGWPSDAWEWFWKKFPNKIGKADARKAFDRMRRRQIVAWPVFGAGLEAYINKTDERLWCNPATWINGGRWDDKPAPRPPPVKTVDQVSFADIATWRKQDVHQ